MALWAQIVLACGNGADPRLIDAIAAQESGRNPAAISPLNRNGSRDYGVMQINDDANFSRFGLNAQTALDPCRSVDAGTRHLIADAGPEAVKPEVVEALRRALVRYNGSPDYPRRIMARVPTTAPMPKSTITLNDQYLTPPIGDRK